MQEAILPSRICWPSSMHDGRTNVTKTMALRVLFANVDPPFSNEELRCEDTIFLFYRRLDDKVPGIMMENRAIELSGMAQLLDPHLVFAAPDT